MRPVGVSSGHWGEAPDPTSSLPFPGRQASNSSRHAECPAPFRVASVPHARLTPVSTFESQAPLCLLSAIVMSPRLFRGLGRIYRGHFFIPGSVGLQFSNTCT